MIPIAIICYNNYKYVENMIQQILKINGEYHKNIIIMNNCSTCPHTINFLKNTECKIYNNDQNNGPWIWNNANFYNSLPDKFILTDADLELNKNIPSNFIEILSVLSDKYACFKVGFALDISDFDEMYQETYAENKNIYDLENQYWQNEINDDTYELYYAPIDTTFHLVNKNHWNYVNVRIADNFTAKHLPWYKNNKIYNIYENYSLNTIVSATISTTSKLIKQNVNLNYLKIKKNNELFLIKNDENDQNLSFWKNIYSTWENEIFCVFDKFLDKNKIFIDIGGWIGTTCMYGSRNSKHVYIVEADNKSCKDMKLNLEINCNNNYEIINKAIYNVDNIELKFGKNKFLENSKMNDSTSQIYENDEITDEYYLIDTITVKSIIENNNINMNEISLIKSDIEGGEEYILNDMYEIHEKYNVPLYVSFHHSWWKDKNLDRFEFLTETQKKMIMENPFTSILFS